MTEYRRVAHLLKARGVKGALLAQLPVGIGPGALVGLMVHVVPPTLRGVRQTTVVAASAHARGVELILEDVVDATVAHELVGRFLLAAAHDLPVDALATLDAPRGDGFVGKSVNEVRLGLIGMIVEERLGSAQTLWVVEGDYGEVLVPAADELIIAVEEAGVLMDLPQGLLELNR
jgi:16S rRNA processing protein RimM